MRENGVFCVVIKVFKVWERVLIFVRVVIEVGWVKVK